MIMRFGLPGHEIRINGSIYYAMVRFCCTLPGWALLIWFWILMRRSRRLKKFDMRQAGRRGKTEKHAKYRNWLRKVLFFAVMAGGAAALLWYGFRFPGEFIPSRWSDFSFYAEKFTQVKEMCIRDSCKGHNQQGDALSGGDRIKIWFDSCRSVLRERNKRK